MRPDTLRWPLYALIATGTLALVAASLHADPSTSPPGLATDTHSSASETYRSNVPEWMARLVPAPDSPESKAYAAAQRSRLALEKQLKLIRANHFRSIRNLEKRQLGILKLREFTDPAAFPSLLTLFEREDNDVRSAVLNHLADQRSDQADATLAWAAVFGVDDWQRSTAQNLLYTRVRVQGAPSDRVRTILAGGLADGREEPAAAAASLIDRLDQFTFIPSLINAQTTGGSGGGGGSGGFGGNTGAIATILIGTQQAFVSDLTPVVGDSAVAFDPTISVLTEGSYLSIGDAYVTTYRSAVHTALVNLSTRASGGRSTAGLGYSPKAWNDWYTKEFLPAQAASKAAASAPPAAPPPSN